MLEQIDKVLVLMSTIKHGARSALITLPVLCLPSLPSLARKPLLQVLEQIYKVPGLLSTMHEALASGSCQEAAPLGWFLLTLASKVRRTWVLGRLPWSTCLWVAVG